LPLLPWLRFLAVGETPVGLRVDGEPLPPTSDPRRALARQRDAWLDAEVRVVADDRIRRRTRRELGVRVELERTIENVAGLGRSGLFWRDLPALYGAWAGRANVEWSITVDGELARRFVRELASEIDRPPRPSVLAPSGRIVALSADGLRLERAESLRRLMRALSEGRRAVALPVARTSTGVGEDALPPVTQEPATVVLASYSTTYRLAGVERDRAHNVRTAASYLDGAVIPAHGRLSFNERVGPRDRERGYRDAHVIVNGEMVDGIGGGVCQVASTFHAAAFLAGLDIVDHTPHSRPSEYIPMGLDATVVWPRVDLVVANPFPFPLTVRAVPADGRLVVELSGPARGRTVDWRTVDWRTRVLSTEPFSDRYVEDPAIAPGRERVSQRGIRGFLVLRQRTYDDATGVHTDEVHVRYPPTDRIVRVPPGTLDPTTGQPAAPELAAVVPDNPF
jgi:vancomycin resistance protein YoaR